MLHYLTFHTANMVEYLTDKLLQFSIEGFPFHLNIYLKYSVCQLDQCPSAFSRLVSQCLLSLYIYTCYPATQINLVNKYAASKVSLLYLMVFCLSVTHSLANSFANAFFKYNVQRWRQAEIAFPKFSDHFPPAIRIYLGRMLGGDRNDACRRRACVRATDY